MKSYNKQLDKDLHIDEKLMRVFAGGKIDADTIINLQRNFTKEQLLVLEKFAKKANKYEKLKKQLAIFETGYQFAWTIPLIVAFASFVGWLLPEWVSEKIITTFPKKTLTSFLTASITLCSINLYLIGTLLLKYKELTDHEIPDDLEGVILSHFEPVEEENRGTEWVSAPEILKKIGVNINTRQLGKVLKRLGFIQKRNSKMRLFLTKKVSFS